MTSKVMLTVDMDMWWHCRWASGSAKSRWSSAEELCASHYKVADPYREMLDCTEDALSMLEGSGIKATFFTPGEMAQAQPQLIRRIADMGHEIACHGWSHRDASIMGRDGFREEARCAKGFLEELCGAQVRGFRAPNLVVEEWMHAELVEAGFLYDSSICPFGRLAGKFGSWMRSSSTPYFIETPSGRIPELPIFSMPLLAIPGGSGISTRILGAGWSLAAMRLALRHGHAVYYFHPYELAPRPQIEGAGIYERIFLMNTGAAFKRRLGRILKEAVKVGTSLCRETAEEMAEKGRN